MKIQVIKILIEYFYLIDDEDSQKNEPKPDIQNDDIEAEEGTLQSKVI